MFSYFSYPSTRKRQRNPQRKGANCRKACKDKRTTAAWGRAAVGFVSQGWAFVIAPPLTQFAAGTAVQRKGPCKYEPADWKNLHRCDYSHALAGAVHTSSVA